MGRKKGRETVNTAPQKKNSPWRADVHGNVYCRGCGSTKRWFHFLWCPHRISDRSEER